MCNAAIRFFTTTATMVLFAIAAQAQIVDSSAEYENIARGAQPDRFMGPVPANLPSPSPDPRDLNGHYVTDIGNNRLGGVQPPPAAPAPAAAAEPPPALEASAMHLCLPEMQIGGVAPYGGQIIQTPGRVTIITEYNHVVKRVYLDRDFPQPVPVSYEGFSIGHWDGDTLVIETRGLKGAGTARAPGMRIPITAITRVVERLRKIDGGRRIEDVATIEGTGPDGKPVSTTTQSTMLWRPDVRLLEFVCEEAAGRFFN